MGGNSGGWGGEGGGEVEGNVGGKDEDGGESGRASRGFMFINLNLMDQAEDRIVASCTGHVCHTALVEMNHVDSRQGARKTGARSKKARWRKTYQGVNAFIG